MITEGSEGREFWSEPDIRTSTPYCSNPGTLGPFVLQRPVVAVAGAEGRRGQPGRGGGGRFCRRGVVQLRRRGAALAFEGLAQLRNSSAGRGRPGFDELLEIAEPTCPAQGVV